MTKSFYATYNAQGISASGRAEMGDDIRVVVDCASGAHYKCVSMSEAHRVFDNAPVANEGYRLLTVDGVIVREEWCEGA